MFNFGPTSSANTSTFAQSTPVNQNRTGSGFLFGNTTVTQPSTLASTPFSSTSLFGAATPASTTLQVPSTGTGTIHKFDATAGIDKINKNGIQTQIRTKIFNLCAMPVYEKKSMEELRLEDYIDNRKFQSTTTSLFPSASSTPSLFGGTSTTTNPATTTSSLFNTSTTMASSTFNSNLFGNKPALSTAPTLSFSFGSSAPTTTTTTAVAAPFSFGSSAMSTTNPTSLFGSSVPATAPATSVSPFTFGSGQPPAVATTATTAPAFNFAGGGGTSLFPTTSSATTAGTSFGFSVSKPATSSTFSFAPTTAGATAPSFNLFPTTTATAAPTLFTATNQPTTASPVLHTQSSVDTKTHLQLFQTMLNIQPFNSELAFLARNIKPNIGLDRTRLRTAPDSTNVHPLNNVFSPLVTKPSVLTSSTSTPPSTLVNPLSTHSHTLPSVLLPSSTTSSSIALFGKRKLADSFLDDDDDNSLMMDDGPSSTMTKLPRTHVIKRPRVLDMNKIRSVVLGGGGGTTEVATKDENLSETYVVKSSSDNLSGWKKFATYDTYLASKNPSIENSKISEDDKQIHRNETKFEQERAFRLPRLTHDDYYTTPTIDELRPYFNDRGQCFIKEFTVGREHYGSVTFQGSKMNLAGLDLNQLIEIGRRQVTVYPDDSKKPAEGEEFNCQATIALFGVYPIDRSVSNGGEEVTDPDRLIEMNYGNYLRDMTKKFPGKFIGYDVYTGTWTFKVEHF